MSGDPNFSAAKVESGAAQNEKIAAIESRIAVSAEKLGEKELLFEAMNATAADLESKGEKIPDALRAQLKGAGSEIAAIKSELEAGRKELSDMKVKSGGADFDIDHDEAEFERARPKDLDIEIDVSAFERDPLDFDIDVDEAAAGLPPEARASETPAIAAVNELPPEQKFLVWKGISNLGFTLNHLKNQGLSRALDAAKGKAEKGGTMHRLLEAASESYGKEAERARKQMERKGVLKQAGNLGSAISWARVGWDLLGRGASTLNPLRNITAAAMAVGRGAEIGKEARLKNAEVKEKTRVQDAEVAFDEATAIYEKASAGGGDRPVTREDLQKVYVGKIPGNIMKRLEKGAEAGVSQVIQAGLRGDLGWAVGRIDKRLKAIEADPMLGAEAKEVKRAKLIASHEQFLLDMDRLVGQAGAVDVLAYSARLAEKGAKAAQMAMIVDSLMQLAGRAYVAFEDHKGAIMLEEVAASLKEKYRQVHEAAAVKAASVETLNKLPEGAAVKPAASGFIEVEDGVKKGEGYSQFIARQLKAHPEKFGYDAKKDGALAKWADGEATKVVKESGLYTHQEDVRLEAGAKVKMLFDPATRKLGVQLAGGEEYHERRVMPEGPHRFDLHQDSKFAEGTVGKFNYDAKGGISGFESPLSEIEKDRSQDLLVSDEGLIRAAAMNLEDRRLVDSQLAVIYKDQEVLEALVKDGRGNSAEANALRALLAETERGVKDRWGVGFLSTEHYEREQLAEAHWITMKDFEVGEKIKGVFVYNASGGVAGFKPGMLSRMDAVKSMIDAGHQREIFGANSKALLVTRIWEEEKVLAKLTAEGKGGSAEARWLEIDLLGYKKYLLEQVGGLKAGALSAKGYEMMTGIDAEEFEKARNAALAGSDEALENTRRGLAEARLAPPREEMGHRGSEVDSDSGRPARRSPGDDVVDPFADDDKRGPRP